MVTFVQSCVDIFQKKKYCVMLELFESQKNFENKAKYEKNEKKFKIKLSLKNEIFTLTF